MEKQQIDTVLFDMDGTLLDSEWFYFKAWKSLLTEYGIPLAEQWWLTSFAGKTDRQAFAMLTEQHGLEVEEIEFHARKNEQLALLAETEQVHLMPGVRELLDYLRDHGTRMAVVTSSKRVVAEHHLGQHGLLGYFEGMVTRSEVVNPKPAAEPYERCVQQLGVDKSRCVVLEDSSTGVAAAKAAGLTCYGVQEHAVIRDVLEADRLFYNLFEIKVFFEHTFF